MNDQGILNPAEPLDWEAVERANLDLGERLFQTGLSVAYDEEGDTLFAAIGANQAYDALTEEILTNVFVRIEPTSLEIVGFMILNFASDFLAHNKLAMEAIGNWFNDLRAMGGTAILEGSDAKRVEAFLQVALSR